jgi:transcription elongation GreA/GreB family factor
MSEAPSKKGLREELEQKLAADLAGHEAAHRAAMEGATHEEAKPENDKDTRALEQSYLARGEAQRIEELRHGLAEVRALTLRALREGDPIGLGALVTLDEGDQRLTIFIAPHGGGVRLADGKVQVVTPRSPLGRELLGKRAGDDCELTLAGRVRSLSIVIVE